MSEEITGNMDFGFNVVKQLYRFTSKHLEAADYFAKCAEDIEKSTNSPTYEIEKQQRAYVTGTIFSAVAALESFINELHFDAQDNQNALKNLDKCKICLLGQSWTEFDNLPTLDKYQKALERIGVDKFDKGQSPYQDADNLRVLRNALVHYEPEFDNDSDRDKTLGKRLNKIKLNKFYQQRNSLCKYLSSDCAQRSVKTVKEFLREFCMKAQISERFEHLFA